MFYYIVGCVSIVPYMFSLLQKKIESVFWCSSWCSMRGIPKYIPICFYYFRFLRQVPSSSSRRGGEHVGMEFGWKEYEMNMDFYTFYNFFCIVTSILMRHSIHVFGMSTLHACTLLVICGSLRFMTLCKFKQHVTNMTKLCTIAYPRLDMNFKLATTIRMRSNIVPSIIHIKFRRYLLH